MSANPVDGWEAYQMSAMKNIGVGLNDLNPQSKSPLEMEIRNLEVAADILANTTQEVASKLSPVLRVENELHASPPTMDSVGGSEVCRRIAASRQSIEISSHQMRALIDIIEV